VHFGEDSPSFRALIDNLDEAFWLSSADGNEIFYVSPVFERIWLQMSADLHRAPRSWLDAIHPDDRSRVERSFEAFLASPADNSHDEQFRIVRSDGSLRWIRQRALPARAQADTSGHHVSIVADITDLHRAQETLSHSNEKLLKLTQYQETVNEAQRTRIAREIHDELGQALTVINLDLQWLLRRCPPDDQLLNKLRETQELVERTSRTVQDITLRLRPATLGTFGLEGALNWYISRFCQQNEDLTCRQSIRLGNSYVDHDCSIALYRILQEALTNISRHARANAVVIDIAHEQDAIRLMVEDDGIGISEQDMQRTDAWGLIGMRERVDSLRGRFEIRSAPGQGTRVTVYLPLIEVRGHDGGTREEITE
jgi:PAS domain S-box-containing protein